MKKRNRIAVSKEAPTRISMVCIRELDGGKSYEVYEKEGSFDAGGLFSKVWYITETLVSAYAYQDSIFKANLMLGFIDIESAGYTGTLTRKDFLHELEKEAEENITDERSVSGAMIQDIPDDIVICINNVGIEDKFDLGIEYVFERHKDGQMIYVYDKNGVKGEFFYDRFKVCYGKRPPLEFKEIKLDTQIRIIGDPLPGKTIFKHFT